MNRRQFVGTLSAGAAALAIGPSLVLEGCSTSWIQTALKDLPVIVNIATTVAQIVADALGGGVISAAVAAAIKTAATAVQTALVLVEQLVTDYQSNPQASTIQKILTALQDVQTQLKAILDAAHIDNAALRATISGIIGLAITVVSSIISILPTPTPKPAAARVGAAPAKPLSASQIKSQANAILNQNGYGNYAIK